MNFAALKGHPRLTPARADLAAFHLKDEIKAPRYSDGVTLHVCRPFVGMSGKPDDKAEMTNQLIFGEAFTVYDLADGWSWGQAADGYVGYVRAANLREAAPAPTHRVVTIQLHVRPARELKARPVGALPYGSFVTITGPGETWSQMEGGGYVATAQLRPVGESAPDWVTEAEGLRGSPYLWGGRGHGGVDCSGLIQIAMQMAGLDCPRDTDMQEIALGDALPDGEALRRGDLVFWKGHVGVMTDAETLFHANAHHMAAAHEPLAEAKARIAASGGGAPSSVKRIR